MVLRPNLHPALPRQSFIDVPAHSRRAEGIQLIDALLAGNNRLIPCVEPVAVGPVWPFEREGKSDDVMLGSARLWGVDMLVEALLVKDDNDPVPVPSVSVRYAL